MFNNECAPNNEVLCIASYHSDIHSKRVHTNVIVRDMATQEEAEYKVESVVCGHHVYKHMWTPYLGERLSLCVDVENAHDYCAVSVMKDGEMVDHILRHLLRALWHFIAHGGKVVCELIGKSKRGHRLEVPCTYTFTGSAKLFLKS